jgi:hypothetical protein
MRTIRFIINKKSLDAAHQGFPCSGGRIANLAAQGLADL